MAKTEYLALVEVEVELAEAATEIPQALADQAAMADTAWLY